MSHIKKIKKKYHCRNFEFHKKMETNNNNGEIIDFYDC